MKKRHSGLFVALWLSPSVASQLAIPGGESADQLHVTLCYCGNAEDFGRDLLEWAIYQVAAAVSDSAPLTGKVSGLGRFQASETSDGKDVLYASVDVPGLVELRCRLADVLIDAGVPPRTDHGFDPHITLSYLSPDTPNPIDQVPMLDLVFDRVTINAGDLHIEVPMSGRDRQAKDSAMAEEKRPAVKFVGEAKDAIEGWGMPFGGPFNGKDWHGEFFTKETDYSFEWFNERPLLYAHGEDEELGTSVIGRVKTWTIKDKGVWVQAQLDKSSKYFDRVSELIDLNALYFSSGAMGHLVQTKKSGEIKKWPWVEMTLTPQPANLFASLDYSTAQKHCKAAGLDVPQALKDALTGNGKGASAFSVKGMFEAEYAERTPSIWDLWSTARTCVEKVGQLVANSKGTDMKVDADKLVGEILIECFSRMRPVILDQIAAYSEGDCREEFYLKSSDETLDALINTSPRDGLPLAKHIDRTRAVVESCIKRAKAIQESRGRGLGAGNIESLKSLQPLLQALETATAEVITSAAPASKKSAAQRDRDARYLTLKSFQLDGK